MWKFFKSRMSSSDSDAALISAYRRNGDLRCIGILYDRYAQIVYAACMKYLRDEEECKDAVNRIFEKLVADLKRFEVQHFSGWLHKIAYNYCMTQLEMKQRTSALEINKETITEDEAPEPEYGSITDEQLTDAINQLQEHQRQCIQLFFLQQKTYVEVAAETGYSLLQVKSYLQNGKRNLKLILTQNENKGRTV